MTTKKVNYLVAIISTISAAAASMSLIVGRSGGPGCVIGTACGRVLSSSWSTVIGIPVQAVLVLALVSLNLLLMGL